MQTRRIVRTGILNILFLLGFLLLMFVVGNRVLLIGSGNLKLLLMVLLVFIPSLVSMMFYYLQDRAEPEPVVYVVYAFLAGMAAAALGAIPLWHYVFRIREWIFASSDLFIAGSFLVLAPVASLLLYVVLRYGFYPLEEFDEPVDGMVYGAVAGVGMAFTLSVHHLISRPDCTLFVIAHVSTTHILIYSAVGALIGYVMGRTKFCRRHVDSHSLFALFLGCVLLGVYHMVNDFIFVSGFEAAYWLSFALTLIYALLVLGYGVLMMRRLSSQGQGQEGYVCPKADILTILFAVVLLLAAGVVSDQGLKGTVFHDPDTGISFRYSHALSRMPFGTLVGPGRLLAGRTKTLFAREGSTDLPVYVAAMTYAPLPGEGVPELMRFVEVMETESMTVEDTRIGGKKGMRLSYSFIRQNEDENDVFPRLIQVHTDLIPLDGPVLVFIYRASAEHFSQGLPLYEEILNSVRWDEAAR
ncbi:MAG: PrsW family glutamic-type intramembrane protease [Candidatus Aminicenantaceae bacterium]